MTINDAEELEYSCVWPAGNPAEGEASFLIHVVLYVGIKGERAADAFDLTVCSPDRLTDYFSLQNWTKDEYAEGSVTEADVLPGGNVMPVRGLWLMRTWSRSDFRNAVERLFRSCLPAPDWGTFAYRVGQVIPWEFDYQHEREQNKQAGLHDFQVSFWHDEWQPRF